MRPNLQALAVPAVMQRLTLLLNHLLWSEPAASQRLRPHAGRRVRLQLQDWPQLLPSLPDAVFTVTPAGLLEWNDAGGAMPGAADLDIMVQASNPLALAAGALMGRPPAVKVAGDAALAGDVNWLFENLRWDVQDDLARWLGDGAAQQLSTTVQWLAQGVRQGLQRLADLAPARWPGGGAGPTGP